MYKSFFGKKKLLVFVYLLPDDEDDWLTDWLTD